MLPVSHWPHKFVNEFYFIFFSVFNYINTSNFIGLDAWMHGIIYLLAKNLNCTVFRTFQIEGIVSECQIDQIDFNCHNMWLNASIALSVILIYFCYSKKYASSWFVQLNLLCASLITLDPRDGLVLGTLLILKIATHCCDTAAYGLVPPQNCWN